jgi:hypothetical protein
MISSNSALREGKLCSFDGVASVRKQFHVRAWPRSPRAEGKKMSGAARRQGNWTTEEDRRLLDLIEAGKSWVFISANLKRPARTIHHRLAYVRRQTKKADLARTVELGLKAKGK